MYNCQSNGKVVNGSVFDKYYTCTCENNMDLVIVFDGSINIQPTAFTTSKDSAKSVLTKLSAATGSISVGLVQYSTDAVVVQQINPLTSSNLAQMNNNITNIVQIKGSSSTTQGLLAAIKLLKSGRSNVKKSILFYSDGNTGNYFFYFF
jgi:hypothetical protein